MQQEKYNSYYEQMANKLADMIENNEAPWQRPWQGGQSYLPYNIKSGKEYQGINMVTLFDKKYVDPRWVTYKQANDLGGYVRAGEKGKQVLFFQNTETVKEIDKDGNEIETKVLLEKPVACWSTVFNVEQCEGLPELDLNFNNQWDPIEKAQEVIDKSEAVIKHSQSGQAFYDPRTDNINLPLKEQFPSADKYYRTALHELGHWTGHESRLDRSQPKDKQEYAKEELVAEITSFITGSLTGLGHEPSPDAIAYIKSWSKCIRDDPKYLVKACQEADKASKFLIGDLKNEINKQRESIAMATIKEKEKEKIQENRVYINVPIKEKDEAKKLGAKWDRNAKSWFIPENYDINIFKKWEQKEPTLEAHAPTPIMQMSEPKPINKFFIAVPYVEKDEAKKLGAKWDKEAQSWYCDKENKGNFAKWFVENAQNIKTEIPLDAKNEFLDVIKQRGITENELIADGKSHRIAVEGDKQNEKSGFYVLHTDGVPNGYFMNNRTSQEVKWVQKGYILTEEEKTAFKTVANAKNAERKQLETEAENKAVEKLRGYFSTAKNISDEQSPYFDKKQIHATKNVYISPNGDIALPLINTKGEIVSAQYITGEGTKRFAHDTKKSGAFHVIDGDLKDIAKSKVVILAEGYSTANTIYACLGKTIPVIATMGVANIEKTIVALHEKFNDLKIIIAADNDLNLVKKGMQNVGATVAKDAAEKHENVSYVVPKIKNKEIEGDFNDMLVKNENKEQAVKNIASVFKGELTKIKNKTKEVTNTKDASSFVLTAKSNLL